MGERRGDTRCGAGLLADAADAPPRDQDARGQEGNVRLLKDRLIALLAVEVADEALLKLGPGHLLARRRVHRLADATALGLSDLRRVEPVGERRCRLGRRRGEVDRAEGLGRGLKSGRHGELRGWERKRKRERERGIGVARGRRGTRGRRRGWVTGRRARGERRAGNESDAPAPSPPTSRPALCRLMKGQDRE